MTQLFKQEHKSQCLTGVLQIKCIQNNYKMYAIFFFYRWLVLTCVNRKVRAQTWLSAPVWTGYLSNTKMEKLRCCSGMFVCRDSRMLSWLILEVWSCVWLEHVIVSVGGMTLITWLIISLSSPWSWPTKKTPSSFRPWVHPPRLRYLTCFLCLK